jgi:hypothetical protein
MFYNFSQKDFRKNFFETKKTKRKNFIKSKNKKKKLFENTIEYLHFYDV